jgi:3-dehydroquinate synthase
MLKIHNCSLEDYLSNADTDRIIVICDKKVLTLYKKRLSVLRTIAAVAGEKHKTLDTTTELYKNFIRLGVDRDSFIIGIGGGSVCDLAGFAASTFMRGIPFAFVPTTLLALVDASMGGKNGVNFLSYKNLIGTFNQPQFILHDFSFLKTLGQKDIMCGIAEVIKHSFIADPQLYDFLKNNISAVKKLEADALRRIVDDSVRIKMGVVERDERELGERRILNFGHTLGHAIENVLEVGHGLAVSKGMYFALKLSNAQSLLSEHETKEGIALLNSYGYKDFKIPKTKMKNIIDSITKDKKKSSGIINFVLLDRIGHAVVKKLDLKFIEEVLHDLC